jgi:hypothetical protein
MGWSTGFQDLFCNSHELRQAGALELRAMPLPSHSQ